MGGGALKVLEIYPYLTSNRGGVERHMLGLSAELAKRGHEVTAALGSPPGASSPAAPAGVALRRLAASDFDAGTYDPPFLSAKGFAEAAKGLAPDVVHIHFMWTPDYTRSLRGLARGAAVVYTLHNSFGYGEGVEGRAAYVADSVLKLFLRNCDLAVCVSDFIRRDLIGRGIPAGKLRVVPSGLAGTSEGDLEALRRAPPPGRGRYAAFAGRLERTKGLGVLVEAARLVKPPLNFVILGEGPERDELVAEARDFGVADRFSFPGFVDEHQKLEVLAHAELFVYPATFEPFGLALLEAMDLGSPILSTSVGGIPEVVGKAGRLVPPGDADALAAALNALASDGEARAALSRAGRARAARFAWSQVAPQVEAAFEAARKAA